MRQTMSGSTVMLEEGVSCASGGRAWGEMDRLAKTLMQKEAGDLPFVSQFPREYADQHF